MYIYVNTMINTCTTHPKNTSSSSAGASVAEAPSDFKASLAVAAAGAWKLQVHERFSQVYVCIHEYADICVYTYRHTCTYMYVWIYAAKIRYVYMYTYTYVDMDIQIRM